MGTTACLSVDTLDVDDSERVAWDDTTLVKRESELSLGLSLVHETLGDVVRGVNDSVGVVFNGFLLSLGQTLEVGDVKMSLLLGLLGTSLPDVRSEN